jgi:hypothetical protein
MRIYPPTLSTEAAVWSETLTVTYKTTRYHITADRKIEQVIFLNLLNVTITPDVICLNLTIIPGVICLNLTITPDVICSYYAFRLHLQSVN